jgi:bifunctional non-homologous end joining protein LigD
MAGATRPAPCSGLVRDLYFLGNLTQARDRTMSPRRAIVGASAQPAASDATGLARGLPRPGAPARPFVVRHLQAPPFRWQLQLDAAAAPRLFSLPNGLPWAQGEARPAIEDDAGETPPIWDEGRYRVEDADDDEVVLALDGGRIRGRYALRQDGAARLALRRIDPASVRPMPDSILPMLAHAAPYPAADEASYAFELKWDGIRAIAHVRDGQVVLRTRNLNTITDQYPELKGLGDALKGRSAILDGEIVAPDRDGRPSFERLQGRSGVTQRGIAAKLAREIPVVYVAFDILYLDGHDVTSLPYEERRGLLGSLGLDDDHWRVSPARIGDGKALLAMPGWEGVVAKRLGSPYEPGARSRAWLKIKTQKRQELVIGGWSKGRGARLGRIGALHVGYYDDDGRFRYAGKVGTGFTAKMLDDIESMLRPDARATSPFIDPVPAKGTVFVDPRYVAEFEFTEWTSEGRLRHPSFNGLRDDKDPRQVVREE